MDYQEIQELLPAPHLHFEVRDKSGAIPLNPLQYGFAVKDNTNPGISWLKIYALDTGSIINGTTERSDRQGAKHKSGYFIPDTIAVRGNIGFGNRIL